MMTTEDLQLALGRAERAIAGRIRRMAITVTARALWQLVGHRLLDGKPETRDAEAFTGIGFYARPRSGTRPEAIVMFTGEDAARPVIIATRDEDTRKAIAGDLAEGETQIHGGAESTPAIVRVTADGHVEIRSPGGVAVRLPTLADVQTIRNELHTHAHLYVPYPGGVAGAPVPTTGNPAVTAPAGTDVFKAE